MQHRKYHLVDQSVAVRLLKVVLLLHGALIMIPVASQSTGSSSDSVKVDDRDGFISRMTDRMAVKVSLTQEPEGFELATSGQTVSLRPNLLNHLRVSSAYRFISFSFGFAPGFLPGNEYSDLKGRTRHHRFGFTAMPGHWVQALYYTRTTGYYLENTGDYVTGWRTGVDPFIQFPDLRHTSFAAQTGYRTNRRMSFNALVSQGERQERSAGTFLPQLSYAYYELDDRTALNGSNSSQRSRNYEALLSAIYIHCFVVKRRAYLALGGGPGAGYLATDLLTRLPGGEIRSRQQMVIYRVDAYGAIGYSGDRFFVGAQFNGSVEEYTQERTTAVVVKDRYSMQLFAGFRFGAPGFVVRSMDKLESRKEGLLQRLHGSE